ncbi:MAG: efflux RND transporter periplasmic adaptor subunit [Gammaproteobacteria bacterium]|nr:MAG: efflux RND transporter periplasmic adaptor subunit [Gammaproteobacteria bacterium]
MIQAIKTNQSVIIALMIAVLLTGWIASGAYSSEKVINKPIVKPTKSEVKHVRSRILKQVSFAPKICTTATTKPSKTLKIKSEISGQLVSKQIRKGDKIKKGDLLFKIDIDDRLERKKEAEAQLERFKLEYKVAQKLQKKNFSTETNLAAARANLEGAKTRLAQIQLEIENISVTAPFDGVINTTLTEEGDFITPGKELAELIAIDPIVFDASITEQNISKIKLGTNGQAILLSGLSTNGAISYISSVASSNTRTFAVEFEANNKDNKILAGLTAELCLNNNTIVAHTISPSMVSLDANGKIGVKTVTTENTVKFLPVEIINSSSSTTWVAGLPEQVQVITVGHGFVDDGETVKATLETAASSDINSTPKSAE